MEPQSPIRRAMNESHISRLHVPQAILASFSPNAGNDSKHHDSKLTPHAGLSAEARLVAPAVVGPAAPASKSHVGVLDGRGWRLRRSAALVIAIFVATSRVALVQRRRQRGGGLLVVGKVGHRTGTRRSRSNGRNTMPGRRSSRGRGAGAARLRFKHTLASGGVGLGARVAVGAGALVGTGRLRALDAIGRVTGSLGMGRRRAAVFIRQGRVTAQGRRTGMGRRQTWSNGTRLVHVARSVGKGTLPIQSATLLGNELATFLLRHVAAGAQRAIRIGGVRDIREDSCGNQVSPEL